MPPTHSLFAGLGLLLPNRTSSLPSPPGSPLLPQRGGPGRAQEETGTRPLGLGVCGEGFWSAVWSCWEGRWGEQG